METPGLAVAELDGAIVAWASLVPPRDGVAVLEDLWVEPGYMGRGIGSALFEFARDRAEGLGAHAMEWEAEPNAIGFYERMRARQVRVQVLDAVCDNGLPSGAGHSEDGPGHSHRDSGRLAPRVWRAA